MKAKNMTKRLFAGLLAAAMVFTSAPMTQAEAAKKKAVTITVTTQAELNAALAKKGVTSIVIKTKDNVTLKLNNAASKAKLVVDAPNARISNSAKLAGITIKDAKAFTEKSVKGNSITVADKKLSLTVAQAAQNVTVRSSAKNADINLKVNGELKKLTVDKKADISIKGSTDQTVTIVNNAKGSAVDVKVESAKMALTQPADVKIAEGTNIAKLMVKTDANIEVAKGATVDKVVVTGKDASVAIQADGAVGTVDVNSKAEVALTGSTDQKVELNVNAKDAAVSTAVKTEVNVNADAEVSIEKGAEGSSVAKADGVETKVSNASDDKIVVTDSKGNESSVDAGKTAISNDEGTKEETKEETKDETKKPETPVISGGDSGSTSTGNTGGGPTVIKLTSMEPASGTASVRVGATTTLTPTFIPANTTFKNLTWSVEQGAQYASVDQNGVVTGKKEGTCVVKATSAWDARIAASWTVTVSVPELKAISIWNLPGEQWNYGLGLYPGEQFQLQVEAVPVNASLGTLVWTSDKLEIATVNNGVVTAVSNCGIKSGSFATITVSNGAVQDFCIVYVKDIPADKEMNQITFMNGESVFAKKTVESNGAITVADVASGGFPAKEGHNFVGWYKDGDENQTVIKTITELSSSITLHAKFEPKQFTVTFVTGGAINLVENVAYNENVSFPAVEEYTDTHGKLVGWTTSQYGSTPEYPAETTQITGVKQNLVLYPIFSDPRVCVTVKGDEYVKIDPFAWVDEDGESFGEYALQNISGEGCKLYGPKDNQDTPIEFISVRYGYNVTEVSVDGVALNPSDLRQNWCRVKRDKNHVVVVTSAPIKWTVKEASYVYAWHDKITEAEPNLQFTEYTVTASSIRVKDLFEKVSLDVADGLTNPKVVFAKSSDNSNWMTLSEINSGTAIQAGTKINLAVKFCGDNEDSNECACKIALTVNAPNYSLSELELANNENAVSAGGIMICTGTGIKLDQIATSSAIHDASASTLAGVITVVAQTSADGTTWSEERAASEITLVPKMKYVKFVLKVDGAVKAEKQFEIQVNEAS